MFDWRDYLRLANSLLAAPQPDEAAMRTAVGRAYYAAFNLARSHLVTMNRLPALRRQNSHEIVWQQFAGSTDPLEVSIGQSGYRLRSFRNRVDYDLAVPNLSRDLPGAMRQAQQLVDRLALLE